MENTEINPQKLEGSLEMKQYNSEQGFKIPPDLPNEAISPVEACCTEEELLAEYHQKSIFRKFFVEMMLSLYMISIMLYKIPVTNFIGIKVCLNEFDYNETFCESFQEAPTEIKGKILARAQFYGVIRDCLTTIPGAIAAIIMGQYMARYGFKKPILLTLFGGILTGLAQIYTTFNMPLSAYYNAFAELFGAVAGGAILMSTAAYTYLAIVHPKSLHTRRIMYVGLFNGFPIMIAVAGGGYLTVWLGLKNLLIFSTSLLLIPAVLIIFFFEDIPVPKENMKDSWKHAIFTSLSNGVVNGYRAFSRKRPERKRAQLLSLYGCFLIGYFGISISNGDFGLNYAKNVLSMKYEVYSLLTGVSLILSLIIVAPAVILLEKFKVNPLLVIIVGAATHSLRFALLTLTEFVNFVYYIQLFVFLPFIISLVSLRANMTNLLERYEVGAAMAILSSTDKLVPLISSSMAAAVYKSTSESFPGCVFLIATVICSIPIFLSL